MKEKESYRLPVMERAGRRSGGRSTGNPVSGTVSVSRGDRRELPLWAQLRFGEVESLRCTPEKHNFSAILERSFFFKLINT